MRLLILVVLLFSFNLQAQYYLSPKQAEEKRLELEALGLSGRTVSGHTQVWLVTQNWHEGGFEAKKYEMIGCWGVSYGPQAAQFGKEFMVVERGCGANIDMCSGQGYYNVNALTCAQKVEVKYDEPVINVQGVEVNATGCEFWNEQDKQSFIKATKAAALRNFPDLTPSQISIDVSGAVVTNPN